MCQDCSFFEKAFPLACTAKTMKSPDCIFAAFGFVTIIIILSLLVLIIAFFAVAACLNRRHHRKLKLRQMEHETRMESRTPLPRQVVAPSYLTRTPAARPPRASSNSTLPPQGAGGDGFEQVKLEEEEITWRPRIYVGKGQPRL